MQSLCRGHDHCTGHTRCCNTDFPPSFLCLAVARQVASQQRPEAAPSSLPSHPPQPSPPLPSAAAAAAVFAAEAAGRAAPAGGGGGAGGGRGLQPGRGRHGQSGVRTFRSRRAKAPPPPVPAEVAVGAEQPAASGSAPPAASGGAVPHENGQPAAPAEAGHLAERPAVQPQEDDSPAAAPPQPVRASLRRRRRARTPDSALSDSGDDAADGSPAAGGNPAGAGSPRGACGSPAGSDGEGDGPDHPSRHRAPDGRRLSEMSGAEAGALLVAMPPRPGQPSLWIRALRRAAGQVSRISKGFATLLEVTASHSSLAGKQEGLLGRTAFQLPRDRWLSQWYHLAFEAALPESCAVLNCPASSTAPCFRC